MLRRVTYYSVRGTFHVWWGKCRRRQRNQHLTEKFVARWRGYTVNNTLFLWWDYVKKLRRANDIIKRFEERRVCVLARKVTKNWFDRAKIDACWRQQKASLDALAACSSDSFFSSWSGPDYTSWCGIEVDQATMAVTKLVLPGRLLKSLPEEIKDFRALNSLYLENNHLEDLPSEIGDLQHLQFLRLNSNRLKALPHSIGQLLQLKVFAAAGNALEALPSSIGVLTNITMLNVQHNRLRRLPTTIGNLICLKQLQLNGNRLAELPRQITQLTALQSLVVSSNKLISLPPELWSMPCMELINLSGNKLRAVPDDMSSRTLEEINLEDNVLEALPGSIENMGSLKVLNLTSNRLKELPNQITRLTALEVLNVASNNLARLPEGLSALTALRSLYAFSNRLFTVPSDLLQLQALEKLSFSSNEIEELPRFQDSVSENLRFLCLNENKLSYLHGMDLARLSSLEILKLADNSLSEVPEELAGLSNLQELSLDGNPIKEIPPGLTKLADVCEISLEETSVPSTVQAELLKPHAHLDPLPPMQRRRRKRKPAAARPFGGLQTWSAQAGLRLHGKGGEVPLDEASQRMVEAVEEEELMRDLVRSQSTAGIWDWQGSREAWASPRHRDRGSQEVQQDPEDRQRTNRTHNDGPRGQGCERGQGNGMLQASAVDRTSEKLLGGSSASHGSTSACGIATNARGSLTETDGAPCNQPTGLEVYLGAAKAAPLSISAERPPGTALDRQQPADGPVQTEGRPCGPVCSTEPPNSDTGPSGLVDFFGVSKPLNVQPQRVADDPMEGRVQLAPTSNGDPLLRGSPLPGPLPIGPSRLSMSNRDGMRPSLLDEEGTGPTIAAELPIPSTSWVRGVHGGAAASAPSSTKELPQRTLQSIVQELRNNLATNFSGNIPHGSVGHERSGA